MKGGKIWWRHWSVGVWPVRVEELRGGHFIWRPWLLSKVAWTQPWGQWAKFATVSEGKGKADPQGPGRKSALVRFLLSRPQSSSLHARQGRSVVLLSGQKRENELGWTVISPCGTVAALGFLWNLDGFSHPLISIFYLTLIHTQFLKVFFLGRCHRHWSWKEP